MCCAASVQLHCYVSRLPLVLGASHFCLSPQFWKGLAEHRRGVSADPGSASVESHAILPESEPVWSTATYFRSVSRVSMQTDSLCLCQTLDVGLVRWQSLSPKHARAVLDQGTQARSFSTRHT